VASTVDSLYQAGADLLAACVAALNLTATGAPTRVYVADGPVALDCEQVTVHFASIGQADTSPSSPALQPARRAVTASVGVAGMIVTATRCVPVVSQEGRPPSASAIEASARVIAADGWAIWNHLHNEVRAGSLFAGCQGLYIDPALPITPSGGVGGWTLAVRLPLEGIPAF
jgi:hypothetical protein